MGSGMLVYYLESPDTAEQWDEVQSAQFFLRCVLLLLLLNVKINVALSKNASRTWYTIKIKLMPMTHLPETRTGIQRGNSHWIPARVSGASCNKICASFQR